MNAFDLIQDKLAYNQWANQQLITWLQQQPAQLFEQEVVSSFPNINKLMHHIMEAELYYFSILRQSEETYPEELTTEQIFEQLLEIDEQLLNWLKPQAPAIMDNIITLKRAPFTETYTTATIITHMVNHTTYHRGQVVAVRHQLAMPAPPKMDYYRYFIALQMES